MHGLTSAHGFLHRKTVVAVLVKVFHEVDCGSVVLVEVFALRAKKLCETVLVKVFCGAEKVFYHQITNGLYSFVPSKCFVSL